MPYEFGVIPKKETANDEHGITIDSPWMARRLLRYGHRIIDVKPNPENRVKTRFIFMRDETFYDDLKCIKGEGNTPS